MESGAKGYFSPAAPAVPISIYTEKLKTIFESIQEAQVKRGVGVIIATVSARGAVNNARSLSGGKALEFKRIMAVARVYENPRMNQSPAGTGLACSDIAEAVAWYTTFFKPADESRMLFTLEDVSLSPNSGFKDCLAYDVIYKVEGTLWQAPAR
jgi:hypothetical protein